MKELCEVFYEGVISAFNPWGPIRDRRRFRPLLKRKIVDAFAQLRREGKIP